MAGIKSLIKKFLKKKEEDERVENVAPVSNEVVSEAEKQVETEAQEVVEPVAEVEPPKPELDAAAKKQIKNEYKKGHKQTPQGELLDLYMSLARQYKLSRAKGEQNLSKDRKAVTKLSTAWIVRLERLLKGENFEDVQAEVDGLYSTQTALYRKKLNELLAERNSMTEEEIERQQEEYNNILKLIKENQYSLKKEEKEKIYLLYKEIKQEEHAVLLTMNDESDLKDETLLMGKKWADIVKTIELGLKEPRYITIEDDIKWLRQKIVENKDNSQKYYHIAINRHELFEHIDEVEKLISELYQKAHADGKKIELVIDDDGVNKKQKRKEIVAPYNYTEEELDTLYSVNWKVDKLYFSEFYPQGPLPFDKNRLWTYDEVRHANYWKNKNIAKIEKMDLSPFEKVLLVHHIVTEGKYQSVDINDTKEFDDLRKPHQQVIKNVRESANNKDLSVNMGFINSEKSRTFLTGEDSSNSKQTELKRQHKGFVCCGFASHAKAYMDTMGDPNIQCEFMDVAFYDKETGERRSSHSVLKVTIKDDEYDMKGEYVWDPCWDSNRRGYAYCLFPLEDYLQYNNDKEMAKVGLSEGVTARKAILITNLPSRIDPDEQRLVLDNPNVKPSQPIPFVTFDKGLHNLAKKANETEGGYTLPDDFAAKVLTETIHHLDSFDPELAKNAFYDIIRDYYLRHLKEFPDWKTKFTKYNNELSYNE